jgi:hypothetical protein
MVFFSTPTSDESLRVSPVSTTLSSCGALLLSIAIGFLPAACLEKTFGTFNPADKLFMSTGLPPLFIAAAFCVYLPNRPDDQVDRSRQYVEVNWLSSSPRKRRHTRFALDFSMCCMEALFVAMMWQTAYGVSPTSDPCTLDSTCSFGTFLNLDFFINNYNKSWKEPFVFGFYFVVAAVGFYDVLRTFQRMERFAETHAEYTGRAWWNEGKSEYTLDKGFRLTPILVATQRVFAYAFIPDRLRRNGD